MFFVFHHECCYKVEIRFKWKTCGRFAKHNTVHESHTFLRQNFFAEMFRGQFSFLHFPGIKPRQNRLPLT